MTFLYILAIVVSILLILIVLIQNPKGGGISANFSAANQIAGVKKTNDFIEKATWTLAIALLVLSLGSSFMASSSNEDAKESIMQEELENSANTINQLQNIDPGLGNMEGEQSTDPSSQGDPASTVVPEPQEEE